MPRSKTAKINVTQREGAEVPLDVLADEIVKVSKSAQSMLDSRLTEKALLILLKAHTKVPEKTIKAVLKGAATLAEEFVKR